MHLVQKYYLYVNLQGEFFWSIPYPNKPENTFKPKAREQETFTTPKGLEVFSSLFKLFQVFSNLFKSFQVFSRLFKSFQIFSSLFTSFHVFSSLYKSFQVFSRLSLQVLLYALTCILKILSKCQFFSVVHICSSLCMFVQVHTILCKSVQSYNTSNH